jgi:hypothetical protein
MVTATELRSEIRRREVGHLNCPANSAPVKAFCRKAKSLAKRTAALAKKLAAGVGKSSKRKSGGRARSSRKSKKMKM